MKKIFFIVFLNMTAISLVAHFIPGLNYGGGLKTLFTISIILAVTNIFIKPIIKILTLPIELVTLGLFGIVINAGMLYLTAYLISDFSIRGFYFTGFENIWFSVNSMQIPNWGTAVIASTLIGLITSTILWLTN